MRELSAIQNPGKWKISWALSLMKAQPAFAVIFLFTTFVLASAVTVRGDEPEADHPKKPRELYNDGTQKLREGNLPDAEVLLQDAVASQDARIQPPALYNLGLARFQDGEKERTNAPDPSQLQPSMDHAGNTTDDALQAVNSALAGDDVQAMVDAYLRGRGARRELKAATDAVKHALETYNSVLTKWHRASGDFKSSTELAADKDAQVNGDLMDRRIAWLVDQIRPLSSKQDQLVEKGNELRRQMEKLKGKISKNVGDKMPGNDGDPDDDGDQSPKQPKGNNGEEGPPKSGRQMQLSSDEAKRLLNMLRLDADRKLPPGGGDQPAPPDHKGRDW